MYVYKLIMPDGSEYIGSCANLEKRMREHKSKAKTDSGYQAVCNAISKCGFDKIKIEVLAILETRSLAYEFEENAIKVARQSGALLLNADLAKRLRPKTKKGNSKLMSRIAKAAWKYPETRDRLVRAAKRRALANPDEMKKRQKKATLARIKNSPLVAVYTKQGKLILKTRSTNEIANILNVKQSSVCRYIRKDRNPRDFVVEVIS